MTGGLIIAGFVFLFAILFLATYLKPYFDKDEEEEVIEKLRPFQKPSEYSRMLAFDIVNNSDEIIELDLCNLDSSDSRYSFTTSDGNYKKLLEYLKSYSLSIVGTKVIYQNANWQKDIIKSRSYSPFDSVTKPVFIAIDDFDLIQLQNRSILSKDKYQFDFFNTLLVKVNPKETKNITLLVANEESPNQEMPVICGIVIKNNSDKPQRVELFSRDFLSKDEYKFNVPKCFDIESLFDSTDYQTILNIYDSRPLIASKIRIYAQNNTKGVSYSLNFDNLLAINRTFSNHREYYDIELKEPIFIGKFEVEVESKSEMIVIFK
jgi:hypothetical protein